MSWNVSILLVFFALALKFSNSDDIWNDIPCYEDYMPQDCTPEHLSLMTVDAYDKCGPAKLRRVARNYFLGASGRRLTYKENKNAFSRINIVPRVLTDISRHRLNSTVLGMEVEFPIGVSPVAVHKLAHPEGEIATVRGMSSYKTIMVMSNFATTLIEDVGKEAKGQNIILWMQVYLFTDRRVTLDIVRRAEKSGFKGFVVTVDANVHATVTCDGRGQIFNENLTIINVPPDVLGKGDVADPSATFADITWLKSETKLPIIVKGILNGEDAKRAILAGASAIFVSNHGGRQLDGGLATIDVLPKVVAAVNKLHPRREVYMDGGVRSGTDVFKALAWGAKMVFVGRPQIWGLALGGSDGVKNMMNTLRNELNQTMLLSGMSRPSDIKSDMLMPVLNQKTGILA